MATQIGAWATYDYLGPGQRDGGLCERCGCCDCWYNDLDDLYYCSGFCDRNALHMPPEQTTRELIGTRY